MAKQISIAGLSWLVGIIGAALLGLLQGAEVFEIPAVVLLMLAFVGVIIGVLNIDAGESTSFMIAVIALTASATALGFIPSVGEIINSIFSVLLIVLAPAVAIVAAKTIYVATR